MKLHTYLTAEQWESSLSSRWRMSLTPHTAPGWHILFQKRQYDYYKVFKIYNINQLTLLLLTESSQSLPSPWGPVVLLNVQCSSLIKWPLRTMSWRVLAFSRPTLRDKLIQLRQTHRISSVFGLNLKLENIKKPTWWCRLWCNTADTLTSAGLRSGSPDEASKREIMSNMF